jgi:hypothetical protein
MKKHNGDVMVANNFQLFSTFIKNYKKLIKIELLAFDNKFSSSEPDMFNLEI